MELAFAPLPATRSASRRPAKVPRASRGVRSSYPFPLEAPHLVQPWLSKGGLLPTGDDRNVTIRAASRGAPAAPICLFQTMTIVDMRRKCDRDPCKSGRAIPSMRPDRFLMSACAYKLD